MTVKFYLNKIGFPLVAELTNLNELPGPGEEVTLTNGKKSNRYEVTEVKKDIDDGTIYIYVDKSIN